MKCLRGLGLALLLTTACGGSAGPFVRAKNAADRAKTDGHYDEAARLYGNAARAPGTRPRDRDEGLYLEAATLVQAGRTREAEDAFDRLVKLSPRGERTPRAAFDRAFLAISANEPEAWVNLERTLFAYPTAGSARRALTTIVDHENDARPGGGLAWLDANLPRLSTTELGEDAAYGQARELERVGRDEEARDAYVRCAQRYPYPGGTLTDDAWWNASQIDERSGRPMVAIDDLRRLLASRERPAFNLGSYERPRYSPAQFHIAEIYRDALHDDVSARHAFHTLFTDFPTSHLRPSALWNEALLARRASDATGACNAARSFVRDLPESRYAACAPQLCAQVSAPSGAPPCRAYLRDQLAP